MTSAHISCPSSGLSDGNHAINVSVDDNVGNNGTGSGSVGVDTTDPVVSNVTPSSWTSNTGPSIEADLADTGGSGIDTATASIVLDTTTTLTGCTVTGSSISCPTSGLSQGAHTFSVTAEDNVGNSSTNSGGSFTYTQISQYFTWYDYGNANSSLFAFDPSLSYQPVNKWASGPGNWEWSRTRTAVSDRNNDGKTELNAFYDYGNANTGLFVFDSGSDFTPVKTWESGPGNWDLSRTRVASSADQLGDGVTELYVLYNYGNANTGLFVFDPSNGSNSRPWLSGAGNWDWNRSHVLAVANYDGDATTELAVFYDYGNATTGIFFFDPDQWSNPGYTPTRVWLSGPGDLEFARSKVSVADQDNDGKGDLALFYDYGNAVTGLLLFNSGTNWNNPVQPWTSNPGDWDWNHSKVVSGADLDDDGITELAIIYDYGAATSAFFLLDGSSGYIPEQKWLSGSGDWDWGRTKPV